MNTLLFLAIPGASFLKIGIILLAISALLMRFVAGLKKVFVKNKKAFFLYAIIFMILFGLTGLISNEKVLNNLPLNNYIGFQVIFVILGVIHMIAVRKVFPDLNEKLTSFLNEFLYTFVIALLGATVFMYIAGLYKPNYVFYFLTAFSAFFIPFMAVKLYEYAISIPVPIYKTWKYPSTKNIKDPSDEELTNPLVISFEFNKEEDSSEISNFRLKAPEKMEFGKLFYFFINDYNERNPESKISYLNKENEPYEWIFYKKGSLLTPEKYINYTHTIDSNAIRENDVIICQRA